MTAVLQRCATCGTVNYPVRALCRSCLGDDLAVLDAAGSGLLLAAATLHRSFDPVQAASLPLRIGTVLLDLGPHLHAFLDDAAIPGARVLVTTRTGPTGAAVWQAALEVYDAPLHPSARRR